MGLEHLTIPHEASRPSPAVGIWGVPGLLTGAGALEFSLGPQGE